MPEHTEALREIVERWRKQEGAEGAEYAAEIEKLLASADVDLVKKWREQSKKQWNDGDNGESRQSADCAAELETWLAVNLPRIKVEARLEFPTRAGGLTLKHNDHKGVYESAEKYANNEFLRDAWESEEEKQKAILEDSIWTLQWYPETPVGFCVIAASTLEKLRERIASLAQGAKDPGSASHRA